MRIARSVAGRLLPIVATILLTGCARFEYDVVQPPDLAQHVPANGDVVFSRNPLLYRLRSYDNHLVIQIQNPTPQPIQLLGGQSFVVDPEGQSRPLQTQTIGPASFIKLILPPLPPEAVPAGPTIGFGIGFASRDRWGWSMFDAYDEPAWVTPRYYAVYGDGQAFWSWEGETDVRLSLSFAGANQPVFTQAFQFHRRKM